MLLVGVGLAVIMGAFAPPVVADGSCCFYCGGHEVCCNFVGGEECGCISSWSWCEVWCGSEPGIGAECVYED
jgi:hypothetical protein